MIVLVIAPEESTNQIKVASIEIFPNSKYLSMVEPINTSLA